MKKNFIYGSFFLFLVAIISFLLPKNEAFDPEKKTILSTTVMIDSIVREIVGDKCNICVLMEGEVDPHSYQMRKGDIEKFEAADLIFANGLSLEHNPSLLYILNDKHAIFLGDRLLDKDPHAIISTNQEIDPHIWMDLSIMQRVVDDICVQMCLLDKDHEDFYLENTANLKVKIEKLDESILEMMAQIPDENRYIVSSHDAFNYFVKRYFRQRKEVRLFSMQGLSPESEISLKRMSQVIDFIKEHKVHAIFYESNLPKDAIWKVIEICKKFDIDVKISEEPLYGDTLGGMTYLEMIAHNADVISRNLKGASGEENN